MMILAALMMLMIQDNPASPTDIGAADGSQRWSILADPCAADRRRGEDVVVCGKRGEDTPRLPLPAERGPPDRPMPSNPDVTGAGALAVASAPCATRSEGCTVGVDMLGGGTALIRLAGKLIDPDSCCERPGEGTNPMMLVGDVGSAIGKAFKKKPDKSKRVPIRLDDLPPAEAQPAALNRTVPTP